MKKMRVLSLFDGISCGRLALERAGIKIDKYYASEIDPTAIKIATTMFPDIIEIGDVCKINFNEYVDKIDMIIGGSPCQDLSIAKQNREGLKGERSKLFWEYIKALQIIKPKYFLLENVASMKDDDRDAITEVLKQIYSDINFIEINSSLVSAQYRRRYYWTNIPIQNLPDDRHILVKDILEYEANKRYKNYTYVDYWVDENEMTTPKYNEPYRIGNLSGVGTGQANRVYSEYGKSVCINANGGGTGGKTGLYRIETDDGFVVRKLSPRECCRLQTYDERCFDLITDLSETKWYQVFGNGWTVDVISHIFSGLLSEI